MLELMWPYRRHLDVFAGTQRYASEVSGWTCEIDEFLHKRGDSVIAQFARYDGVIARASKALATKAARANVPLVNVMFNSPQYADLPGVFPDFRKIGYDACEHLIERGFRNFACLSIPRERAQQEMMAAFHSRVEESGCVCRCAKSPRNYYRSEKSWARFQSMLNDWISSWRPPVALFVSFNDVTTRYVVNACRRHGLRVPEDVALITSSNEPMIGAMPPPSITSVEVNYEQIGYQAAKLLDQLMCGKRVSHPRISIAPTGIIARDSTDFFAVDDEIVAFAMRYIERHTRERITVDDVACEAGVSRRTLERRFQQSVHRTVAAEIRRLRVLKAKRLLAESDLLVKQIAHEAGFNGAVRMHEVFVREEGVTPSTYRDAVREGQLLPASDIAPLN